MANESQVEGFIVCNYLVSPGYAIMDMAGMPEDFSRRLKIDHYRVLDNPIAINSYQKEYKYVIENFNIDPSGCYLLGISNGGLTSCNLVNLIDIPFITQAGLALLLSIEEKCMEYSLVQLLVVENLDNRQNRANIIRLYGMNPVSMQKDVDNAIYKKRKKRLASMILLIIYWIMRM